MSRRLTCAAAALVCTFAVAGPALAAPVATTDAAYTALGRVFPDPLAGCQLAGQAPCDPNAEGNVAARTFVGIDEFHDGLVYMNSNPAWQKFMEVYILDGKDGTGSATKAEVDAAPSMMFPGDNLVPEFTPNPTFESAGLPTSSLGRQKSDLTIVRVTDESVSDAGKKRMALSLSIHGIERAGAEGGIRTIEDLVTAGTSGRSAKAILSATGAPTFAEALSKAIIYFTFPNPDGWRRGSQTSGGAFFQRYNGNGIDPNRDYLDVGYSYRGYSGDSEPETNAFKSFFRELLAAGKPFAAGDDLHGQPEADALSYTLLPHGQHDLAKNTRLRETAIKINRAQYEATKWSPLIQDNDQPVGGGPVADGAPDAGCVDLVALGTGCRKVYAQTWGTVYDTINYTTTGTLGDWFDSKVGLNADGIDNEMSFSHLDKNTTFEPETEQLHVEGNRAIIFAHLSEIIAPPTAQMLLPDGRQGYVASPRITQAENVSQGNAPEGTVPQATIAATGLPSTTPADHGKVIIPFTVKRGRQTADGTADAGKDLFDGGMRVDITTPNVQGIATGSAHLLVQCQHCNDHVGSPPAADGTWITVAEDYNQSPLYLQAGVTVGVNLPAATYTDPAGAEQPVAWRAVLDLAPLGLGNDAGPGPSNMAVSFSSGPASLDGNNAPSSTSPDKAPRDAAIDVANTDFFTDLNKYIPDTAPKFEPVDPQKVAAGTQSLAGFSNLVLADDIMPGSKLSKTAWIAKLTDYVRGGGNLVLTDGAIKGLADLFPTISSSKITKQTVYAGQVTFCTAFDSSGVCTASTLGDPLNEGIALPGSRFNSGMRRQLFEPTPLGFAIQDKNGADASNARQWQIDATTFKAAGGRISATSADSSPRSTVPVTTKVTMGEITVDSGQIRIAGALLPQPETKFDHPLGLAPYSVTYTGYALACNLLDAQCPVIPAG